MIKITKSDNRSDYKVGDVRFVPMTKVSLRFVSKEETK